MPRTEGHSRCHGLAAAYVSNSGHGQRSSFGETLPCPPPWLIGSHCFHPPAILPPRRCVRWCGEQRQKKLSCALCLTACPTPIPRGTGFLARDQVLSRGVLGAKKEKKTILKYPYAFLFWKLRIMCLSGTYEFNCQHLQGVDTDPSPDYAEWQGPQCLRGTMWGLGGKGTGA